MRLESDTSSFFGSRELRGELGQMWEGSPERGIGTAIDYRHGILIEQELDRGGEPQPPPPTGHSRHPGATASQTAQLQLPDAACLWLNCI